ncbi:hypothetical protein ID866_11878 [Astraeus odoratus]|nr:hypothetical protein ID866_11878 [Astraeus odoratus]
MSSPHHTLSPHKILLVKTKALCKHTEDEWWLVSEGKLNPVSSDNENTAKLRGQEKEWWMEAEKRAQEEAEQRAQEEAERKAEEEHKAQEVVARAKEEAEREDAAWRATEAVEERVDAKRRALEERLWEVAGQQLVMVVVPPQIAKPSGRMTVAGPSAPGWRASEVQDPCTRCCNKGTFCILGAAKGKTTVCKACRHAKVSCSWTRKTASEMHKQKWVQHSEETEVKEVINVDADKDKDEEQSHFAVPTHLMEEHRDALRALTTILDMLSTEFYKFWRDYWGFGAEVLKVMDTITQELKRANGLKEEEMGKAKGKGKEKTQEEFRRARMEDDDRDTEMGRAGSSLA